MSLIARLQENIVSRGLGGTITEPQEPEICETVTISLEQIVTVEEEFYPLTGTYAGVEGWKWNKTIAQSLDNIYKRIESSVGGYIENLDEGTIAKDWYGSALSGLKLSSIYEFQDKTKRVGWRPEISKGSYSIFHKSKALNSKSCQSEILSNDLILKEECLENSVQINLFKRDRAFNNIPYIQYKTNETLADKYSFYLNENLNLVCSEVYTKQIGTNNSDLNSIECHSEYLGVGKSSKSICYTEYFPCIDVSVFTVVNGDALAWSEVQSFENSSEDDRHYILNSLKGFVIFPKKSSETIFYIKEDLGNLIEFYQEIKDLPESGFLKINDQEVRYYSKGKYSIYLSSNRVASFVSGTKASEVQKGKHLTSNDQIYVNYKAVPRVDYDVLEENFDDKKINLKPYKKINSNGILELSIEEKHVSKINLTCDKPNIISNIFGTLYVQSDASKITAEVLNSNGKAVDEIKVNFEASKGNFEGIVPTISKVTNLSGEAFTSYSYEYNEDSLQIFANPNEVNGTSYFEVGAMPPGVTVEDITIFQSLKIDPFQGSLGRNYTVSDIEILPETRFVKIILEEDVLDPADYKTMYTQNFALEDEDRGYSRGQDLNADLPMQGYFNYGLAVFSYDNLIKRSAIIRSVEKNIVVIEGINSLIIPSKITLFKRGELKYDQNNNSSHDRLLYKYDQNSMSFLPLKPTRIVGQRIYFDNTLIPLGNPADESKIVAGYKIFLSQLVSLKANAIDPATGFLISSNEIKMKVDFPPYLKGNNGFTFITDEDDEGSALGGANFLTVNPEIPNVLNIIVE